MLPTRISPHAVMFPAPAPTPVRLPVTLVSPPTSSLCVGFAAPMPTLPPWSTENTSAPPPELRTDSRLLLTGSLPLLRIYHLLTPPLANSMLAFWVAGASNGRPVWGPALLFLRRATVAEPPLANWRSNG